MAREVIGFDIQADDKGASNTINIVSQRFVQLNQQINIYNRRAKKSGDTSKKAGDKYKKTAQTLSGMGSVVGGMGGRFAQLGAAALRLASSLGPIAVAGAAAVVAFKALSAVVGAFTSAVKAAFTAGTKFERRLKEIQTIADKTQFSFNSILKTTTDMAAKFGIRPQESAKALYQAISAGATTAAKANRILEAASKLSIGGLTKMSSSVSILSAAVNTFEHESMTAEKASDILFTTIRLGVTTGQELANSLGNAMPMAAAAGLKFHELAAAVGALTKRGITAQKATVMLRQAMAQIVKPTSMASDEAERLGIQFDKGTLEGKGLLKFLRDIQNHNKRTSLTFALLFGNVRALTGVYGLLIDGGAELEKQLAAQNTETGAAAKAYNVMAASTSHLVMRYDALKEAIVETAGVALMQEDALRIFIGQIVEALEKVLKYFRTHEFRLSIHNAIKNVAKFLSVTLELFRQTVMVSRLLFRGIAHVVSPGTMSTLPELRKTLDLLTGKDLGMGSLDESFNKIQQTLDMLEHSRAPTKERFEAEMRAEDEKVKKARAKAKADLAAVKAQEEAEKLAKKNAKLLGQMLRLRHKGEEAEAKVLESLRQQTQELREQRAERERSTQRSLFATATRMTGAGLDVDQGALKSAQDRHMRDIQDRRKAVEQASNRNQIAIEGERMRLHELSLEQESLRDSAMTMQDRLTEQKFIEFDRDMIMDSLKGHLRDQVKLQEQLTKATKEERDFRMQMLGIETAATDRSTQDIIKQAKKTGDMRALSDEIDSLKFARDAHVSATVGKSGKNLEELLAGGLREGAFGSSETSEEFKQQLEERLKLIENYTQNIDKLEAALASLRDKRASRQKRRLDQEARQHAQLANAFIGGISQMAQAMIRHHDDSKRMGQALVNIFMQTTTKVIMMLVKQAMISSALRKKDMAETVVQTGVAAAPGIAKASGPLAPIVVPAVVGAIMGILTALISSSMSDSFHEGGFVGPGGRRMPLNLGPSETMAVLRQGEAVIPTAKMQGQSEGGGQTNVTLNMGFLSDPSRARFARVVDTDIVPVLRDGIKSGRVSIEDRRSFGRRKS